MSSLRRTTLISIIALLLITFAASAFAEDTNGIGFYRYPAIHNETIVFTAEGDLWKVGVNGGDATRLTTHHGSETHSTISPDGKWLAFTGRYEGPTEGYVMPLSGGLPRRVTWEGDRSYAVGWTPTGKLLYATGHFSDLPRYQLVQVDIESGEETILPLAQARYGCYDPDEKALFFTRFPFQGSWAKRYHGGSAQNIWQFESGAREAVLLTDDFDGTSREPMWYEGRIYFLSDRDRSMNIWSMLPDGGDKKQHTKHDGWDVQSAALSAGRIVQHVGADLFVLDIATDENGRLDIRLVSDFDQRREKWIKDPAGWISFEHLSSDGDRIALLARGQVFVAPVKNGRFIRVSRKDNVRYRKARFMPEGDRIIALSDESGEVELAMLSTDGKKDAELLTDNGKILRWDAIPSPNGELIAYNDKDMQLWIFDVERKRHTLVATNGNYGLEDMAWSPDSKWLAYVSWADNYFRQIMIYNVASGESNSVTSDRFHSFSPTWSPDGEWLYFISDRNYSTIYGSVWGTRQQEPYLDKTNEIYMLPLAVAKKSPFAPDNELTVDSVSADADKEADKDSDKDKKDDKDGVTVEIDFNEIGRRLIKVPVKAGVYADLSANDNRLFWSSRSNVADTLRKLQSFSISNEDPKVKTIFEGLRRYQLSANGKKLMVRKGNNLYVFDAAIGKQPDLSECKVDLSGWTFNLDPVLEWKQMFTEAWRLHRDYFYDTSMHSLDWPAMLAKYLPLVERISGRGELSNLLGQMISELEALHANVYGGDNRSGQQNIGMAALGARLASNKSGGYTIEHIYDNDPDYPQNGSPLARADLDIANGDIILAINGVDLTATNPPGKMLRKQSGKEVLLTIRDKSSGKDRDVIIKPISSGAERNLRYDEWEYTTRLAVEENGAGEIGYVHLRSTGTREFGRFARDFYPVFQRPGLIIDNRHNGGGNIDSWIIGRLMRRSWAWWQPRVGAPEPNMQYAFDGHIVVLCDDYTGSDGELLTEGLRKVLGAKVIGTRTWGGEIWLSSSNRLVDRGIATAAEWGVYGPEGDWLIEGWGVEPDIVVENLPHATFKGSDAQLDAAIEYLQEQIKLNPVSIPPAPSYPDKSGG